MFGFFGQVPGDRPSHHQEEEATSRMELGGLDATRAHHCPEEILALELAPRTIGPVRNETHPEMDWEMDKDDEGDPIPEEIENLFPELVENPQGPNGLALKEWIQRREEGGYDMVAMKVFSSHRAKELWWSNRISFCLALILWLLVQWYVAGIEAQIEAGIEG